MTWKHPRKPDTLDLHAASILDCNVDGEWDVLNNGFMTFYLRNYIVINSMVKKVILQMIEWNSFKIHEFKYFIVWTFFVYTIGYYVQHINNTDPLATFTKAMANDHWILVICALYL